ncbi:MAG: hypothetical protein ACREPH_02075 [Rhodanobacteraceae bacterium]
MKRIATTLLVAGLMATPMLALPPTAHAGVSIGIGVSVGIPPPALPVYVQPIAPAAGYIWTPGYWAWDPGYGGYYWVPGTWVMPPQVGLLWTPGWWGWSDGFYRWHGGYWGMHVGFYGGVNYGFGYFGTGYVGGDWRGRQFFYNRAVSNVNVTNIRNVYVNKTVINNVTVNRVSYNGGRGGIAARPTAVQRSYVNQRRFQPTSLQTRQRETAMRDPAQRFKTNQGRPAVFATQHAGRFEGPHSVRQPAAANSRMVAAPHERMPSAANRNHGMVEAPRERTRTMQPQDRSFREQGAAPNRPQMERAHPVSRPQAEMQRERPMQNGMRQPQRVEHAAPRHAPQGRGERGKRDEKHPPKSSGGGRR